MTSRFPYTEQISFTLATLRAVLASTKQAPQPGVAFVGPWACVQARYDGATIAAGYLFTETQPVPGGVILRVQRISDSREFVGMYVPGDRRDVLLLTATN